MFNGGELSAYFGAIFLVVILVVLAIGAALGLGGYFGILWIIEHVRIA